MKLPAILAICGCVAIGCSWNPTRDNPVDPASPYYETPPPRNHAPVIDTVICRTDNYYDSLDNFYGFSVLCVVQDADNNLLHDSVAACVVYEQDTAPDSLALLGYMQYNGLTGQFVLNLDERDFSEPNLENLYNRFIQVFARDDSGAVVSRSEFFRQPAEIYPTIYWPLGGRNIPDTARSLVPQLTWNRWRGSGQHTYDVSIDLYGVFPAWDTTGILASDTLLTITDSLLSHRSYRYVFYTWRLTAVDASGNRFTDDPSYFVCWPDTSHPVRQDAETENAER